MMIVDGNVNVCKQTLINLPEVSLKKEKKNEHAHKNDSLHSKVCAPQQKSTGIERPRGHQARPPHPREKGGVRRFSDLFPPHQVVAPSQFSRDFKQLSFCALQVIGSRGAKGGGGEGGTGQTAWPPSCLYPRFARAPFSVTHASPPLRGAQASALPYSAGARGRLLLFPGLLSRGV